MFLGTSIGLHLGADGRYVMNPGSQEGVYVFSSGDWNSTISIKFILFQGDHGLELPGIGESSQSCVDRRGLVHLQLPQSNVTSPPAIAEAS